MVVHLGAGNRFRDWGEDHFTDLARRLGGDKVAVVLIGGSPEEQQRAARLSRLPNVHDLSGPLPVRELLALIAASTAYVGADSGPLHLASLTATPLVALYGPNLARPSAGRGEGTRSRSWSWRWHAARVRKGAANMVQSPA